jgi:hypothetical protein
MKKKPTENNHKENRTKSYNDQEKDQFIQNLAQVLSNSKYRDKDNEDM